MRYYLFTLFTSLVATSPLVYSDAKQDPLCPGNSCGVQGDEFNFLGQAVNTRSTNGDDLTVEGCGIRCAAEPSCIVYSVGEGFCTTYRLPPFFVILERDNGPRTFYSRCCVPDKICGLTGYPSIKAITEPEPDFGINVTTCHEHCRAIKNCEGIFFYESSKGRGSFCDYSMNRTHIESFTPHRDPGFLYPHYFSRECINPHIRLSGKDDNDPTADEDPDSKLPPPPPEGSSIQSVDTGGPLGQNTGPDDKDSSVFMIDALLGPGFS